MTLEMATIANLDPNMRDSKPIEVLFNPNEYSLNKDNNFAQQAIPGLSSPLLQFVHGNLRTLDMELFFDSYEEHRHANRVVTRALDDVRKLTQPVVDLLAINPETHAPPLVLFTWGGLMFTGVLAKVTQRFTMFVESGVPVRAKLQVTFNEYKSPLDEAKEIKRRTADFTRRYTVGEAETLSSIAAAVYKDPAMWRPIAIANSVDDPRRLRAGTRLTVPSLPYRDPSTGEVFA